MLLDPEDKTVRGDPAGAGPTAQSSSRFARALGIFSVCGLCCVLLLTGIFARVSWLQIVDRAQSETSNTAFFVSEHAEQIFKVADLALGKAAATLGDRTWVEAQNSRQLFDRLRAIRDDIPYITDLWLTNSSGILRQTSFAFPPPEADAEDRSAFKAQLQPGGGLFVGEVTVGRVSKSVTFMVSRRIENSSDGFEGVAIATVDIDYFNDFWTRLTLAPGMRVSLVRQEDMSILASYPNRTQSLNDAASFSVALSKNPKQGIYTFLGSDGERFGSYRQVASLPLFVRVTQSQSAMMHDWVEAMLAYAPFSAIGLIALGILTIFARRLGHSEERSRRALNEAVAARTAELAEQTRLLDKLNATGRLIAAELEGEAVVNAVVGAARDLSGAAYGAFFYLKTGPGGERLRLHVLSGASAADFAAFADPRDTEIFAPTFNHRKIVRSDDVLRDPRYGGKVAGEAAGGGMPAGHLPVRSYLAVPVVGRSGEVQGAILLGHPETGRFGDRQEQLAVGVAAQAAVALDNARLFEAAQTEIEGRKRAEERQKLLIRELNHRVKNVLATVKAVLRLTGRSSDNVRDFVEIFSARINSLAMTHTTLTDSVRQTADLRTILKNELSPYDGVESDHRINIAGPSVTLSSETAVPFGMAVHELTTNAVKHGALSVPTGRVDVEWRLLTQADAARGAAGEASGEGPMRQVQLVWTESGGPPPEPSARPGFGTELLDRVVRMQLQGEYNVSHAADGLRLSMRIPVFA